MSEATHVLSEEQQAIVDAVLGGANVIVDAVAGSGKTTTILGLARATDKKIIQITYNKHLRYEVMARAEMDNLEVHTYHSFCHRYFDDTSFTDNCIRRALRGGMAKTPIWCDVLVVDEVQDMTPLYYDFIRFVLGQIDVQLVLCGDTHQCIYDFMDASAEFLTASRWGLPFVELGLKTTYRMHHGISRFINRAVLGEDRLRSVKSGPVPYYVRVPHYATVVNPERIVETLTKLVMKWIGLDGANSLFILCPSVRVNGLHPIKRLENALVAAGVPCYFAVSDFGSIDGRIAEGKVVFSTFHQSKGRERDNVIVFGFDEATAPTAVCPSQLYVALTRARRRLAMIEMGQQLQFLRLDQANKLYQCVDLLNGGRAQMKRRARQEIRVEGLWRFMSNRRHEELVNIVEAWFATSDLQPTVHELPVEVDFGDGVENVSMLIKRAILRAVSCQTLPDAASPCKALLQQALADYCKETGLESPRLQVKHFDFFYDLDRVKLGVETAWGRFVKISVQEYRELSDKLYVDVIDAVDENGAAWLIECGEHSLESLCRVATWRWICDDKYSDYYVGNIETLQSWRLDTKKCDDLATVLGLPSAD